MKHFFKYVFVFLSCCMAFYFSLCEFTLADQNYNCDCTTTCGDYLGTNYIYENEIKDLLYVLGDRSLGLCMYSSPDLKSVPIYTLESHTTVELQESQANSVKVSCAIDSPDGEMTYIEGWVDARFVIVYSRIYVAMHPTAVYVIPNADAKIIMMIDTYDSLPVIEEYEDFYCVLLSTGVGYVVKEYSDQMGIILSDTSAYYRPILENGYTEDDVLSDDAIATVLDKGMEVTVLGKQDNWGIITFTVNDKVFGAYFIPSEVIEIRQ